MFDASQLDDLIQKLSQTLPPSVQAVQNDIKMKMRAILQAAFAELDLVTREEFDVQTKVLARTREKLQQLEAQIARLEQQSAQSS